MSHLKSIFYTVALLLISNFIFGQLYYVNMEKTSKWEQDPSGITRIKVYWENPSPENYLQRQWVQQAVKETWSKVANIDFVGWEKYDYSGTGIRIYINDYTHPHTKALGSYLNGMEKGMELTFNFLGEYKCNPARTKEYCIKAIAVHEFGHALGIGHEQDRLDCGCKEYPRGSGGPALDGYYVTPCDLSSVMNYCNPLWSNGGKLSKYDVEGIQAVYGARRTSIDLLNKVVYSSAIDKLGESQVWENLNLTLGSQQFIFNINANNKEEIKTFYFTNSGFFNYNITSYSYHKDNKFHKGHGSGTLYIDKNKAYRLEVLATNPEKENFELTLSAVDINATGTGLTVLNTDNNQSKFLPPLTVNMYRNGQKPIHLMKLTNISNEKFYIYADGTIMVYNTTTKKYFECGKKQVPYYKDWNGNKWAWSFYRNLTNNKQETYTISTTGEVWSMGSDGVFRKYGIVTYSDF